jgi:hypothetical protein
VPPRDGDGTAPGDDELVAQIIPLRRRESESEDMPAPALADGHAPTNGSLSPAERSVWDPPTADLRRRKPSHAARQVTTAGADTYGAQVRQWVVGAAVATVAVAGIAILVVALGILHGQPGVAAGRAGLSASQVQTTASGNTGAARRPSAQAAHTQHPTTIDRHHGRAAHHIQLVSNGSAHKSHAASAPHPASSGATTTPVQEPAPAAQPSTDASQTRAASQEGSASQADSASGEDRASGGAASSSQGNAPPHIATPSTTTSQCVPGELGC